MKVLGLLFLLLVPGISYAANPQYNSIPHAAYLLTWTIAVIATVLFARGTQSPNIDEILASTPKIGIMIRSEVDKHHLRLDATVFSWMMAMMFTFTTAFTTFDSKPAKVSFFVSAILCLVATVALWEAARPKRFKFCMIVYTACMLASAGFVYYPLLT